MVQPARQSTRIVVSNFLKKYIRFLIFFCTWRLGLFFLVAPSNDKLGNDAGIAPPMSTL